MEIFDLILSQSEPVTQTPMKDILIAFNTPAACPCRTRAEHLDEKFPFLTVHIGKYWIAAVTFQFILYLTIWYAATMDNGPRQGIHNCSCKTADGPFSYT